MKVVLRDSAVLKEFQRPTYVSRVSSYLGEAGTFHGGPQAFLAEVSEPRVTVHPHFHDVDQFQVFVAGDGRFGADIVRPVSFHFADAFTPYGPIVANDKGISFFTIRLACTNGYYPMPAARDKMLEKPGRNLTGHFELSPDLPQADHHELKVLLDEPDGLRVAGLRLGANAHASGFPVQGGGQYYLVCSGSIEHAGSALGRHGLIFLEPNESAPDFWAGAQGAEVLMVQFPRPSRRLGSDPKLLATRVPGYVPPPGTREQ